MNLLFIAHNIVLNEGDSLALDVLVNKINISREFKSSGHSPITTNILRNLIKEHSDDLYVDDNDIVSLLENITKPLATLFWDVMNLLRDAGPIGRIEILGITLIFYTRISESKTSYPISRDLQLRTIRQLKSVGPLQKTLAQYLQKLNEHPLFDGKLKDVIIAIGNLDEYLLEAIFRTIYNYDVTESQINAEEFANQFEELLQDWPGFSTVIKTIPEFTKEIIAKLAVSKPINCVFNPSIENGDVFSSVYSLVENPRRIKYIGQSTFDFAQGFRNGGSFYSGINSLFGTMNLILHNVENFTVHTNQYIFNSIVEPNSIDCVISQPSSAKLGLENKWQREADFIRFGNSPKTEVLTLQYVLNVLDEKGRAFLILPESFLFSDSKTDIEIRRYLLEADILDSVISIPSGIYKHTRLKTSILVIDKNKKDSRKGKVLFFDTFSIYVTLLDKSLIKSIAHLTAEQILNGEPSEMVCENISNEQVLENKSILSVSTYVNKFQYELKQLIANEEKIVHVGDVALKNNFKKFLSEGNYKLIKAGDLSKDLSHPILNQDEFTELAQSGEGKLINETCVLIATVGGQLYPTLFNYYGTPIVINKNVFPIVLKEDIINPEYFIHELNSELVKEQLRTILRGYTQQYYRKEDLLNLQIRLPKLGEQKQRLSLYKEKLSVEKEQKLASESKIQSYQEDEIIVLKAIKHSFAQKPFKSDLKNIETYLDRTIQNNSLVNWEDPISPSSKSRTLKQVFIDLNTQIDATNEIFINMENLINCDPTKMKIEEVKIISFIKEVIIGLNIPDVKILLDGSDLPVLVDKFQFKELIRNIILNAIKHGFIEGNNLNFITIDIDHIEGNKWRLMVFNSGKPFYENSTYDDFVTFGKRGDPNKGSGIGGYLINKVTLNHKGKMTILEEPRKMYDKEKLLAAKEGEKVPPLTGTEFHFEFPFNINDNV